MKRKKAQKRKLPDPTVIAKLKEWASLQNAPGPLALTMAGELFENKDEHKRDAFFFTTLSREIMVTLVPAFYESQSLQSTENSTSVDLVGFGGKIGLTEIHASPLELLLKTAPPSNKIH